MEIDVIEINTKFFNTIYNIKINNFMRPRYKLPLNKKYFHTKRKIDKKDMIFLKNKIEIIKQKKIKKELEKKGNTLI